MNIIKFLSNPSENVEKSLRTRDIVATFSIYIAVSLLSIVMSVIQNFIVQSPTVEMRKNPLVTLADEGIFVLVFIVVLMAIAEEVAFRLPLKRTKWRVFIALSIALFFLYSKLLTDRLVLSMDDMMLRVGLTVGTMGLLYPILSSSSILKRMESLNYKYYFYSLAFLFGFGHLANLDFQSIDDWSVTALFWIAIYALLKILSGIVLGYARMRHGFSIVCLMHVLHNLPPIFVIYILSSGMSSCASNSDKNNDTTQPKQEVVGGYSDTKEISADDRAMFDKATESIENYTDIKPLSVITQVVAGTNYKFTCTAKNKEGKVVKGEIVIFKPLPHTGEEPSVTKIQF